MVKRSLAGWASSEHPLLEVTVSNTKYSPCWQFFTTWYLGEHVLITCSCPAPRPWSKVWKQVRLIWSSARGCSPPLLPPWDHCFGLCPPGQHARWHFSSHRFGPWSKKMGSGCEQWQLCEFQLHDIFSEANPKYLLCHSERNAFLHLLACSLVFFPMAIVSLTVAAACVFQDVSCLNVCKCRWQKFTWTFNILVTEGDQNESKEVLQLAASAYSLTDQSVSKTRSVLAAVLVQEKKKKAIPNFQENWKENPVSSWKTLIANGMIFFFFRGTWFAKLNTKHILKLMDLFQLAFCL